MGNSSTKWVAPPYLAQYELGAFKEGSWWGKFANSPVYDAWGYKPSDLTTPSQRTYTTYFSVGPDAANYPGRGTFEEKYGIVNSHLAVWGAAQPYNTTGAPASEVLLTQDQVGINSDGSFQTQSNTFPTRDWTTKYGGAKADGWEGVWREPVGFSKVIKQWNEDRLVPDQQGAICNPMNYPNCTMMPFMLSQPAVSLYDSPKIYSGITSWKQGIEDAYQKSYVNGGFDALDEVNTTDSSGNDPCDGPGYLIQMGNALLAVGALATYTLLIDPELVGLLSEEQRFSLALGTLLGTFYWARSSSGTFGDPAYNEFVAEQALGIPIAWSVVDYVNRRWNFQLPTPLPIIIGAGVSWFLLGDIIGVILYYTGFLRDLWGFVLNIVDVLEGFICRILSGNYDSCADSSTLPKARRWDAASIAGKLVDEIRSEEGWDRDDPRSEFCYKALLSSPAIMDMARLGPQPIFAKQPVNFLGPIYARDDLQSNMNVVIPAEAQPPPPASALQGGSGTENPLNPTRPDTMIYQFGLYGGWDGARSGILDTGQYNLFACQNWDRLRNADMSEADKDRHPDGYAAAQQVSDTMTQWVRRLRVAANDPNNLAQQENILGWKTSLQIDPLKVAPTLAEQRAFAEQIWSAKTFVDRLKTIETIFEIYSLPGEYTEAGFTQFVLWNEMFANINSKNPSYTAEDWWENQIRDIFGTTSRRWEITWMLLYTGGCYDMDSEIVQYWKKAPLEMWRAAHDFPVESAEMPTGWNWPQPPSKPVSKPIPTVPVSEPPVYGPPPNPTEDPQFDVAVKMLWDAKSLKERGLLGRQNMKNGNCNPAEGYPDANCFLQWNSFMWGDWPNSPTRGQLVALFKLLSPSNQKAFSYAVLSPPWEPQQLAEYNEVIVNGVRTYYGSDLWWPTGDPPAPDTFPPGNWNNVVPGPLPDPTLPLTQLITPPQYFQHLLNDEGSQFLRHLDLIPISAPPPPDPLLLPLEPLHETTPLRWPGAFKNLERITPTTPLLWPEALKTLEPMTAPVPISPQSLSAKIAAQSLWESSVIQRQQICSKDVDKDKCSIGTPTDTPECYNALNAYLWDGYPGGTSPTLSLWLAAFNQRLGSISNSLGLWAAWSPPWDKDQIGDFMPAWLAWRQQGSSPSTWDDKPKNFPNANWTVIGEHFSLA